MTFFRKVFPIVFIFLSVRVFSLYTSYQLLKSKRRSCIDAFSSNTKGVDEILTKARSNVIGYILLLATPLFQCIPSVSNAAYLSEMSATQISDKSQTSVEIAKPPRKSHRSHLYSVEFTDPPSLLPRTTAGEQSAVEKLLTSNVILFGKHYLDQTDSQLEIDIMNRMLSKIDKNKLQLVIGLPSFPNTESCQNVLDSYTITSESETSGSTADLMTGLKKSQVNDDDVVDAMSVLQFARKNQLMVVPLGLAAKAGDSNNVISDSKGFVASTRGAGFSRYVELVVKEDYKAAFETAAGTSKLPFDDYVGLRLLTEETSASAVASFLNKANSPTIMAVLGDQRDVRFGYGLQERLIRNINNKQLDAESVDASASASTGNELNSAQVVLPQNDEKSSAKVVSVLLNPTPIVSNSFLSHY